VIGHDGAQLHGEGVCLMIASEKNTSTNSQAKAGQRRRKRDRQTDTSSAALRRSHRHVSSSKSVSRWIIQPVLAYKGVCPTG
jgi:hypothetical protein